MVWISGGVLFGEAVEVNGNLDNAGFLEDETYCRHNTITVHGLLTNKATGQINVNGRPRLASGRGGYDQLRFDYREKRIFH